MEAFVYCWSDHKTKKLYIGSHKGSTEDGYVCSSKLMLEEYNKRPGDFSREIISIGPYKDMRILEAKLLDDIDAKRDPNYYNQTNGNENWCHKGHTEESKRKLSIALKGNNHNLGRTASEEHKRKISMSLKGNTRCVGKNLSEKHKRKISESQKGNTNRLGHSHSEETKRKMSESHKKRLDIL